ncbi:hypothetical protein BX285_0799 [Streptomyces sp. 1114.5]|nr:hypothetical protein BX285_0799 [Streptomyces sp. 1114.5]SOB82634.1 hypothetical protein SAMN06272789_2804 [Streptomyces sp. 1331.2]
MVGLTATGGNTPDRVSASKIHHSLSAWESPVTGLEWFFDGLLALMAVLITWFAIFSVMKLYQGQR